MSQKRGTKIPKKNIQPCPFLSVLNPSVNSAKRYKKAPNPIPHHMVPPLVRVALDSHLESDVENEAPLRPNQRWFSSQPLLPNQPRPALGAGLPTPPRKNFRLFFKIGHFYRPLFAPIFNGT